MMLRITVLALMGLSSLASATGMTLMKASCQPLSGGVPYHIHYWTSSAPGGPASYHMDVTRGADQQHFGVSQNKPTLGEALLLVGTAQGQGEGPKPEFAVLYGRNNRGFLDVQVHGPLGTPGPIEVRCHKSPR